MIATAPLPTRLSRRPTAWDLIPEAERQGILDLCETITSTPDAMSDWAPNHPSLSARGRVQIALARFTQAYLQKEPLEWDDIHALKGFLACRTKYVDGYVVVCNNCTHVKGIPASCRRRGCATCGGVKRETWKAIHIAELLDGAYIHFSCTLPRDLWDLARRNPDIVLREHMKAAYGVLKAMGLETIGADVGGTAVLQTWGGGLAFVPHVHMFAPAGGIAVDTGKWVPWREGEMPRESEIGQRFRDLLIERLKVAFRKKAPILGRELAHLTDPRRLEDFLDNVRATDGLVWYKRFEEGGRSIVEYLGNHINGRPLRDSDILEMDDKGVTVRATSQRLRGAGGVTLGGAEFVKEYLSHRLPKGFVAVRSFGVLVGHKKAETIAAIKGRSVVQTREDLKRRRKEIEKEIRNAMRVRYGGVSGKCDRCGEGRYVLRRVKVESKRRPIIHDMNPKDFDSS